MAETPDTATSANAKGAALESLIVYLLSSVPGVSNVVANQFNQFDTEEIDVSAFNSKLDPNGLYFLDHFILAECKNWSSPVGSIHVAWFAEKVEQRGVSFGILFAMSGVTGDAKQRTAAHFIIAKALEKGRRLVVVTRADLDAITGPSDFVTLVQLRICQLIASGSAV